MTNITQNISQETLNTVLVDILKGAKDASSEIYGASKTGIVKAVDFAQEQAPLVVQEFLAWKFAEAIISCICGIVVVTLIGYFVKKCFGKQWLEESGGSSVMGGAIGTLVALIVSYNVIVVSVKELVKVKVAPRVFIIEWVTEKVKK